MSHRSARALGTSFFVTLALAIPLALGCIPDVDPASLVERTRVVAARVSVVGDPTIAWPSPGDAIVIDWVVVAPGAAELIAANAVVCVPLPGTSGAPVCAPDTTQTLAEREPSLPPFRTELVVPSAEMLGGSSSILVTSAVCVGGGTPAFDETGASSVPICEGGPEGARAEVLVLSIPLAVSDEAEPNRHPTLADEPWTLDGATWEPLGEDGAPEACADVAGTAALPRVIVEPLRELRITIGASLDDREEYATFAGDPPMPITRREVLQINHFASAGSMERGLSAVDDLTTQDPPIDVDWELPPADDVPATGRLVRITAVARDGRSGVDHAERVLCVVP